MRTSLNISNKLTMISEMTNESIFQVLEYDDLIGTGNVKTTIQTNIMKKSQIRLRQARIILQDSAIKLEAGVLSYMKGNIDIKNKVEGVKGFGKKFFSSKITGESMSKPLFRGTGEVFLKASFGHFALIELEDEEIVIEDSKFCACEEGIEVEVEKKKSFSSVTQSKEEGYRTKLTGSGIVLLEIPIPEKEILRCKIYRDTLKVDGDLILLRTANIDFTVEKLGGNFLESASNAEGLLNVYRGTGEVWIAPTKGIYESLQDNNFLGEINLSDTNCTDD